MNTSKLLIFFSLIGYSVSSFTQSADSVRLVRWNTSECNDQYDPNKLLSRILNTEKEGELTSINIGFSDNCCVKFDPTITFKDNRLILVPYINPGEEICMCNCCFSIEYVIEGLTDQSYNVYFRNKKLEITDDYYETFDSSQLTYNGDIINKTNKYGFQEGLWISFFPDSTISTLEKYPDKVLYFEAEADWAKRFYSNGKLRSYHRKDTSQSWLESGELAYETIKYQINDTVFHRTFTLYENSQLKEKSLTKIYRVLYDTCDRLKEYRNETIYKESYYQNGQPKYLYSQDTSYQWYENGITKELTIGKERIIRFDSNRNLTSRVFRWKKPGRTCGYALSNSLYVMYANRNEIQEVRLIRDELTDDGTALGVSYTWRWDEENNLIESPRNWSEEMPWERFSSLLEEFHQKQQINK